MGQHKIKTVDLSVETDEKEQKKSSKKTPLKKEVKPPKEEAKTKPVQKKVRSKTYISARRQVDRTQTYSLKKAITLLKKTSYTKFPGTVNTDIILKKQEKISREITFPHPTGKKTKVAIATPRVLKNIEKGKIDFDVLLTTPDLMPKIAKFAKVLGPKGLMPNPKSGTITNKPQAKKKELEAGKTLIKTEKKEPLLHITIGKTNQPDKQLQENVETLINALGARKIKKLVLSATMSPGIKVGLSEFQTA